MQNSINQIESLGQAFSSMIITFDLVPLGSMYFKQAKEGNNEWWIYLLSIVALAFGYIVGQSPMYIVVENAIEQHSDIGTEVLVKFYETMDFSLLHIDSNIGLVLLISVFIGATLFFLLAVKFIHKKSMKGMITHRSRINWPKIAYGFIVWFLLACIIEFVAHLFNPGLISLNVNWNTFLWLALICIFLLPIQTTLEELLFRSYLMKGIGLLSKAKWIPLVVTTLLFGLVHGLNPEIQKYGVVPMQLYYLSAGLLLGIMTIMDDGLELAIGVHWATNLFGAMILSYEGSVLQTNSIWRADEINAWLSAGVLIVSGIIFLLLSKKMFDWGPWSKLTEEIKLDSEEILTA